MILLDTLKTIETLEHRLGELYERYSALLTEDPEAAAFFARLWRDEDVHKGLVQLECQMLTRNPREFEQVQLDAIQVAEALAKVEVSLCAEPPKTLEAMIGIALDHEDLTAEYYLCTVVEKADKEIVELLRKLGMGSSTHSAMVKEFAAARGFLPKEKK